MPISVRLTSILHSSVNQTSAGPTLERLTSARLASIGPASRNPYWASFMLAPLRSQYNPIVCPYSLASKGLGSPTPSLPLLAFLLDEICQPTSFLTPPM